MTEKDIRKSLEEVIHPAKDKSVIGLGMVKDIVVEGNRCTVTLAFSKHRDPLAEYLVDATKAAIVRTMGKDC